MKRIIDKVLFLIDLVKKGEFKFLWSGITRRIYSQNLAYGLKRDLNVEIPTPPTLLKLEFRHYQESDAPYFELDNINHGLVEKQIDHCYVATKDDNPVYRVWLMGSSQNEKIKEFWGSSFPPLKSNEALCENSFTIPKYRGFGIMPYAMAKIAEKGKDLGADTTIIYTDVDHIISLRAGDYAGYHPFILRRTKWFLFNKSVSFEEIPEHLLEKYKNSVRRKKRAKKQ